MPALLVYGVFVMKKIFLILFSVVLLVTGALNSISCSCDKSAPQFDEDPISVSGSLRLEGETVFIDLVITNNTDRGIDVYYLTEERSYLFPVEDEWIWNGTGPVKTSRGYGHKWYQFWDAPGIKAHSSRQFSWNVQGVRLINYMRPDTFVQYVKYSMDFTQLDFEGYGFLDIKEYDISLYLEIDLTDFIPLN
jgi:hypothetical protein